MIGRAASRSRPSAFLLGRAYCRGQQRGPAALSAASAAAVLDMQQHAPPPALRRLKRDVPRALSDAIMKSLSKAREARWQTAVDMRQALLPYAAVRSAQGFRATLLGALSRSPTWVRVPTGM